MYWLELARIAALTSYVTCAGLLLIVSIMRRLQVRYIVQVERCVLPSRTFATTLVVALPALSIFLFPEVAAAVSLSLATGYIVGSICWIVSAFIGESIIITRFGIILPRNRVPERLGWRQIMDFFVTTRLGVTFVVFLWLDDSGKLSRLRVRVPSQMVEHIETAVDSRGITEKRVKAPGLLDDA